MTKSQTRYSLLCLLSASMWVSLGGESHGASVNKLEREIAGLNHKIKKLNIENDNLRAKIDSSDNALEDLENQKDTLEDRLRDERARVAKIEDAKSATIGELGEGFRRADLVFQELTHELATVRQQPGHKRVSALLDDLAKDFGKIQARIANEPSHLHQSPAIHEQLQQRLASVQARAPELIERWIRDKFPNTKSSPGLSVAGKLIFLLATVLVLVVVYVSVKMAFSAIAHSGRIGFTLAFGGLGCLLSGVYPVAGIPLVCLGFVVIVGQAFRHRKQA